MAHKKGQGSTQNTEIQLVEDLELKSLVESS